MTFQIRNSELMNDAYAAAVEKRDAIRKRRKDIEVYLNSMAEEVRQMKGVEDSLTATIEDMERRAAARQAAAEAAKYQDAYEGLVQ